MRHLRFLNHSCLFPELYSNRPEKLAEFLQILFRVELRDSVLKQGSELFAGFRSPQTDDRTYRCPSWKCRLIVERLEPAIRDALSAGAELVEVIQPIAPLGQMALLRDPAGSPIPLIELDAQWTRRAWGARDQFFWASVESTDPIKTRQFFEKWLGVRILDLCPSGAPTRDLLNQLVLGPEGNAAFEITRATSDPAIFPPSWAVYWKVEDLEKFFLRAESLGSLREFHFPFANLGEAASLGRTRGPDHLYFSLVSQPSLYSVR